MIYHTMQIKKVSFLVRIKSSVSPYYTSCIKQEFQDYSIILVDQGFKSVMDSLNVPSDGCEACDEDWVMSEWRRLRLWGTMFGINFILNR